MNLRSFLVLFALMQMAMVSLAGAVEVAFLRVYDGNGQLVELTPGGVGFAHVAIRYRGMWFHAHPFGGVQLSPDLSAFGEVDSILEHPDWSEPLSDLVSELLNKPYDHEFLWGDGEAYYCSELVGVLLNVAPRAMSFEGPYWDAYFAARGNPPRPQGLGISPDGLFFELLRRGFMPVSDCEMALRK